MITTYQLVNPPRPFKTEYSCTFMGGSEYDTITLQQHLGGKDGDHWKMDLNLERWRSKAEMAAYLRFAASIVEGMK